MFTIYRVTLELDRDTDICYNVQVQNDSARVPPRPRQGRGERGECGHGGGRAEAAGTR